MMGHMVLELGYVHSGALAKLSTSYKCSQNVEQHHWSKSSISVEDLIFLWLHKAYKVFFLITLCSFSPLLLKKYEIESTDTETCWRLHVYCVWGLYVDFAVKSSEFMKKRRILTNGNMYLHVDHTETPTYNRQIKNTELLFEISLKINLIESDCKKKNTCLRGVFEPIHCSFSRKINQHYCWILVIHGVLICIKYILNQYHRINVWDLLM